MYPTVCKSLIINFWSRWSLTAILCLITGGHPLHIFLFLAISNNKLTDQEIVWQGKHQGHLRILKYWKSMQIFKTVFCKIYSNEKTCAWKLCSSVVLFGIIHELLAPSSRLWYLHIHSCTYILYTKCYTAKHNICHMKINLCLLCIFPSWNSSMLLELPYNPQCLRDWIFLNTRLANLVFFLSRYRCVLNVAEGVFLWHFKRIAGMKT